MANYQLENQRSYMVAISDAFLQSMVIAAFCTVRFVTKHYNASRVNTDALMGTAVTARYVDESTQQAGQPTLTRFSVCLP